MFQKSFKAGKNKHLTNNKKKKMAGGGPGGEMSPKVAFVFVFNLIIGLGALNLPNGFSEAGIVNRKEDFLHVDYD